LTVTDANGARQTSSKTVIPCPGSIVTNTMFCPLPTTGFNLIFVTDPANPSTFELISSNPGQFYDNVFATGAATTPITISISIPYPFVTQGAFPIQVSSSFATVGGCLVPSFDATSGFTITTSGGALSTSGHPVILLSDYGSSPTMGVTQTTVTVVGSIPATGLVYVTIHLDYGLKGTTGWTKGAAVGTTFNAVNTGLGQTILQGQTYAFSSTPPASTTSPMSNNIWKKDPGFAGVVTTSIASGSNPIVGATIKIYDDNGILLGITATDQNGVYLFVYKYTGTKGVLYTVRAMTPKGVVQTASVSVQSNKFVLQNFVF